MSTESKMGALAAQLQRCSSRNGDAFRETASEAWDGLRNQALPAKPPPAMMAALVIESRVIGQLLTSAELEELSRLTILALQRYEHRTNPPNKLGNLLAGVMKEL